MKTSRVTYIAIIMILAASYASCKKSQVTTKTISLPSNLQSESLESSTLAPDSIPPDAIIYNVGTGSGDLVIDGSKIDCDKNALIKIKGGNYTTVSLKNLISGQDTRIFVKNDGQVSISKGMYTENLRNVTISGANANGLETGIKFENIPYRAITLKNRIQGITLRNLSFKNVSDYVIAGDKNNGINMEYDGNPQTRNENFKILGCLFENATQITFDGEVNIDSQRDVGFFKNVEVAYNTFINTPNAKSVCSFGNVQDYDIHHNTINNVNSANNNHNGIFHMQGNGNFHHNKLTNYQGNAIRMWLYSRGSKASTNEIYNNICYKTRKYGGFELQAFKKHLFQGKTTFANARVYNNTVGEMNTSKDWEGQILDLYNIGGTLEYYNNLGFDLIAVSRPLTNMINNMSNTRIVKEEKNMYFNNRERATDENLSSYLPGIGATIN